MGKYYLGDIEQNLTDLKLMAAFHRLMLSVGKVLNCHERLERGQGRGKPVENCAVLREEDFIDLDMSFKRMMSVIQSKESG